jgi:hypothetical protein
MKKLILIDQINNIYDLGLNCRVYESQKAWHSRLTINRENGLQVVMPKRLWNKKRVLADLLKTKRDWITKHWLRLQSTERLRLDKENIIIDGQGLTVEETKIIAREKIAGSVEEIAQRFDFKYNEIKIKNQKRTWGTCHRNGNLSFNWRIILLPQSLYFYVLCHELTHLKVFSHSKIFWAELEKICPGAKNLRKELKDYEY